MADVDKLMAELGLADPAPARPAPSSGQGEVDALLADLGVAMPPAGRNVGGAPIVRSAPATSGPGAAWAAQRAAQEAAAAQQAAAVGPAGRGQALATHTPDGRRVIHTGPPCGTCGEMVIGKVLNALNKNFHPECFVCVTCKKAFPGGRFVDFEGSPYCENDYQAMFCPSCHVCKTPITDECIAVNDYKWHPPHFKCVGCGLGLVGRKYKMGNDGDVFCDKCKKNDVIPIEGPQHTCAKCQLPILGDYIMLKGQTVHDYHYRCEECGCEFKGGNCREFEGALYCLEDYEKMMKQICGSCMKPILGRTVSALGKVYHPEHFVCYTCHQAFQGGNYFEHDDKAYCEYDYTSQFGDPCAKCGRPVARDAREFEGKIYHVEHFVCHACNCQLGTKGAFAWESKPLCSKCFDKLPSDVRKRIRQKREASSKIAKAKAKEAKKGAAKG